MLLRFKNSAFFLSLFFCVNLLSSSVYANSTLKKTKLYLGNKVLTVEIAKTNVEMAKGLMYRQELAFNEGMFFVYPNEQTLSFWMKNTFIPLSIGFFNKNRELIQVLDMSPVKSEMQQNLPSYVSERPAMYALEVNQGWFKKNKIHLKSKFRLEK